MSRPDLLTHADNTILRPATRAEWIASVEAAAGGDWSGAIEVDGIDCWVDGDAWDTSGDDPLWSKAGAWAVLIRRGCDADLIDEALEEAPAVLDRYDISDAERRVEALAAAAAEAEGLPVETITCTHVHLDPEHDIRMSGPIDLSIDAWRTALETACDRLGYTPHFVTVGSPDDINCREMAEWGDLTDEEMHARYLGAWQDVQDRAARIAGR